MKHTPGPWLWWTSNSYLRLSHEGDGDVLHSYCCSDGHTTIGVSKENARLIAAAPDLLDALQAIVVHYPLIHGPVPAWIRNGQAAIAKATGETRTPTNQRTGGK